MTAADLLRIVASTADSSRLDPPCIRHALAVNHPESHLRLTSELPLILK